jgi:alpha-1,2-mannosyltransferase
LILILQRKLKTQSEKIYGNSRVISFLHPFCNDCGGGEKVLWMMLKGMCQMVGFEERKIKINILCGVKDDASVMKKNLRDRFEIDFEDRSDLIVDIELLRLKTARFLKPKPYLTMLLQIIGQVIFAFEIIVTVYSETIVDTTGLPFTYAVLRLLGRSNIVSYVHYPLISTDMINDIKNNIQGVHSRGTLSKLKFLKSFKIAYYYVILFIYRLNGYFVKLAFCNSSWTYNHIIRIWKSTYLNISCNILYPPCSVQLFETNQSNSNRKNIIVSCAQFRPEKRQKMQIDILRKLKSKGFCRDLKLQIMGSIRDEQDRKLFEDLQNYINQLGLSNDVEMFANLPLNELKKKFENAKIGLHTMRDEHFGISVIEMMAAGLLTVAHRSAGPLNDIIGSSPNAVGILAEGK